MVSWPLLLLLSDPLEKGSDENRLTCQSVPSASLGYGLHETKLITALAQELSFPIFHIIEIKHI